MKLQASEISLRHSEDGPSFFSGINFTWEGSGIRVLMGASGSGKSSLLKILASVWRPTSGRILFDGLDLWDGEDLRPNAALLRKIGFAFQNNALFSSMSVLDNITFPQRQRFPGRSLDECEANAMTWLARVGLERNATLLPHELSGGMRKRLAIARALVCDPEYLFLDDPTAGLDPISSRRMAEMLATLLAGRRALILIVTNDRSRAREWGPDIYLMHARKVLSAREDGNARALLGNWL